jgi:hypothetical protein
LVLRVPMRRHQLPHFIPLHCADLTTKRENSIVKNKNQQEKKVCART